MRAWQIAWMGIGLGLWLGCRGTGVSEVRTDPDVVAVSARETPEEPGMREVLAEFETASGARPAFRVEVADTPELRERGLMHRRSLDPDRGMLFVFPRDEVQSFWMKNTFVALDMLFVSSDGRVVGVVENARPLTLESRSVGVPSRYVVELPAFTARERGIQTGARLSITALP